MSVLCGLSEHCLGYIYDLWGCRGGVGGCRGAYPLLVPNPSVGLGTVGKFWLTRGVSEALYHLGLGTAKTFKKIIDITFATVDIYVWYK